MQTIDANTSVGDLVRQRPARARIFEAHKIDYCCGGKTPLRDACRRGNVDLDMVTLQLHDSDALHADPNAVDADALSLTQLADHIEATHHAYLREELPRLDFMTEKVNRVHGDKEPRLQRVRDAFVALKAELEPHMLKEESILFPLIRQLEAAGDDASSRSANQSAAAAIEEMEHEHDQAGDALAIIREATDDFTPPEWACNTYRAMLDALEQLEADMHQHVHKENNVLFIKTLNLGK